MTLISAVNTSAPCKRKDPWATQFPCQLQFQTCAWRQLPDFMCTTTSKPRLLAVELADNAIFSTGEVSYKPPDVPLKSRMLKMKFHIQDSYKHFTSQCAWLSILLDISSFTQCQMVSVYVIPWQGAKWPAWHSIEQILWLLDTVSHGPKCFSYRVLNGFCVTNTVFKCLKQWKIFLSAWCDAECFLSSCLTSQTVSCLTASHGAQWFLSNLLTWWKQFLVSLHGTKSF